MGESGPTAAYARRSDTPPLPRSRLVVVEVTKIVDIDRPEVVIIDHVELVVAVFRGQSIPSQRHGSRS